MMERRLECGAEYRRDPFTGSWVVLAAGRDARPNEFSARPRERDDAACPFCHEHESVTPPATAQWSLPGSSFPWDVRVVPNKFPAVCPLPLEDSGGLLVDGEPAWQRAEPVFGMHEVIIESPDHRVDWSEFTVEHLSLVFQAYRQRLQIAAEAHRLRYGLIFKNVGPEAGASIEHAHSQLMALREVPLHVEAREGRSLAHFDRTGCCLTCEWLAWELQQQARIVDVSDEFVTVCPWFSRVAGEFWLVPRRHACHFTDSTGDELVALAGSVLDGIRGMPGESARSYNVLLQTAPLDWSRPESSHWMLQVLPRRVAVAGFEWATGCTINTVAPETAAEAMRSVQPCSVHH